jgi:hypothetical protein
MNIFPAILPKFTTRHKPISHPPRPVIASGAKQSIFLPFPFSHHFATKSRHKKPSAKLGTKNAQKTNPHPRRHHRPLIVMVVARLDRAINATIHA